MYNRNYGGFDYLPKADRLSESTRNCKSQCKPACRQAGPNINVSKPVTDGYTRPLVTIKKRKDGCAKN